MSSDCGARNVGADKMQIIATFAAAGRILAGYWMRLCTRARDLLSTGPIGVTAAAAAVALISARWPLPTTGPHTQRLTTPLLFISATIKCCTSASPPSPNLAKAQWSARAPPPPPLPPFQSELAAAYDDVAAKTSRTRHALVIDKASARVSTSQCHTLIRSGAFCPPRPPSECPTSTRDNRDFKCDLSAGVSTTPRSFALSASVGHRPSDDSRSY